MLANSSVILVYQTKLINFLKPKKHVIIGLNLVIGLNKRKESLLEQKVVSI